MPRPLRLALIAVVVIALALWVVVPAVSAKDANESLLKIKTVKEDNKPTEEESIAPVANWSNRSYHWEDGDVKNAKVKDGKISAEVESTIRASGGITVELFCKDNIGHYMPVWGGSVTTASKEWMFTKQDILRQNVDGCYFGVIDTTAQMEAMT